MAIQYVFTSGNAPTDVNALIKSDNDTYFQLVVSDAGVLNILESGVETSSTGGGGITNLDGGRADTVYSGVSLSPIDGGNSTSF